MKPTRTVRTNATWTLIGNGVYGACQTLIWVSLAKLGSPELVGQYAYGQAVASPVMLFSNLSQRSIQATDTSDGYTFEHHITLRSVTTAAALLLIGLVGLASARTLAAAAVVFLVGIAKSIESVSDVYYGLLQNRERLDRVSKSLMFRGSISLVLVVSILALTHSLTAALGGLIAAWLGVWVLYDRKASALFTESARLNWDVNALKRLVALSFPLGVTTLFLSLNASIPRLFLEHYGSERQLGLFSALTSFQTAGMMFITAVGQAATTRLARDFAAGDLPGFRRRVLQLQALALGLGIVTLLAVELAGDRIVRMIFRPEYAGQNSTLRWIAIAAAVGYVSTVFGYAATASRRISFQPYAYATVSASCAVTCWLAVPRFGGLGAAYAMFAAACVGCVWYGIVFAQTAMFPTTAVRLDREPNRVVSEATLCLRAENGLIREAVPGENLDR